MSQNKRNANFLLAAATKFAGVFPKDYTYQLIILEISFKLFNVCRNSSDLNKTTV